MRSSMEHRLDIADRLVRIASEILASGRPSFWKIAIRLSRRAWRRYKRKHDVRDTTTVYVNGRLVQLGEDWKQYDRKDMTESIARRKDGSLYVDERGRPFRHNRIRLENTPGHVHDGISDMPPDEKSKWRGLCRQDMERLNPELWRKAQEVYDRLAGIERDVLRAYTLRDLYDVNKAFFNIYQGKQKCITRIQLSETRRRMRLLKKLPRFKGMLWRGMNFDNEEALKKFIAKWQNGDNPLTGFISTTYVEGNASLYFDDNKLHCVIRIVDSRNGRYVGHLSSTPRDEEVLYSCNQRFRLVEDGETEFEPVEFVNGTIYITAKEVNDNEKRERIRP